MEESEIPLEENESNETIINSNIIQEEEIKKEEIKNNNLSKKRKRNKKKLKLKNRQKEMNKLVKDNLQISTIQILDSTILAINKYKKVIFETDKKLFIKGNKNIPDEEQQNIHYNMRFYFFSLFDNGIKMDEESWYSVTPEEISIYISNLIKDSKNFIITDAFCGCGGNTIFFSKKFKKVYANDLYEEKIKLTINNLKVYNCEDNVEFSCQDFLTFNKKSDYIFLSPPWGGVDYKNDNNFLLKNWINPDIEEIIKHSLELSKNLIFYLPRCTKINELIEYIYKYDKSFIDNNEKTIYLDIQYLCSAEKIKVILILYGEDFNNIKVKDIRKYFIDTYKIKGNNRQVKIIISIAKILGGNKFLKYCNDFNVNILKGNLSYKVNPNKIINYFTKKSMTQEELELLENEIKEIEKQEIKSQTNFILTSQTPVYNISQTLSEEQFTSILQLN